MAVDRLLVYGKAPEAGRVKTRLTPPLPPDEAASVYEACLRDVIALCARERARVELWYHADGRADDYFAREFPHLTLQRQSTGDLGAKMKDSFARSFADGAQHVMIIGSDVPTLPESIINAALDDVRDAELVIGPTLDGGYYLVGLNAQAWPRAQTLFDDIAWSTDAVFRLTAAKAESAGLDTRVLPGWYDVDTIEYLRQALLDAQTESNLSRWATRPAALHFLNSG
jgi:uncharacterized protein